MTNAPHILVIDDELQIQRAIRTILTEKGFKVSAASRGEEGLTLNLKGPLAYNPKARTARQLVVFSSWPSIHHPMTPPTTSRQTGRKAMPAERRGGDRRAA